MRKFVFVFVFFFFLNISNCLAQLFVGDDATIYVNNEVIFVQKDLELTSLNSILYLRNKAQLVQKDDTFNKGSGVLSVYQEGTSDHFAYNYWCSPVGTSELNGNGLFGVSMLYGPTNHISSTVAQTQNYDGVAAPLSIAPFWINTLVNQTSYSGWLNAGGPTPIIPAGVGFTMKGTKGIDNTDVGEATPNNLGSNQRYDFRGKPNNGSIIINVIKNANFLIGNPYPSTLDLSAFLLDPVNQAAGGNAFFWEQDPTVKSHNLADYRGGYGYYSPVSLEYPEGVYVPPFFSSYNQNGSINDTGTATGTAVNRRYSPIGQGFLIKPDSTGQITFKNAHRIFFQEDDSQSQFLKEQVEPINVANKKEVSATTETVKEISHFRLNTIVNNQFTRQLALLFLPEATDQVDFGIEARNMNSSLPNDVTFLISNGSYVIQGVAFDETKRIPLYVKATTPSTFRFSIPELVNIEESQDIYLYDDADKSYHDIKNGSYTVQVPAGHYTGRFKITFINQTLDTPEQIKNGFLIYQDNSNQVLRVSNPNAVQLTSFKLYDITGKLILSQNDLGLANAYSFSTIGLSHGVYIAEFSTASNEKFTQKVVVSNAVIK